MGMGPICQRFISNVLKFSTCSKCFKCFKCFECLNVSNVCNFQHSNKLAAQNNTANIRNHNRTRQSNGLPSVLSDPGPKTVNIPTYGVHCEIPLSGQPVWAAGLSSHLFRQGYGATCNSGQGGLKQNGRYL